MGTLRGGNGDEQPPNGGGASDGVPELPPEWGRIVIPDDASALDDEAAEVRKELRKETRRYRWQRWIRVAAPGKRDVPSLGVPLAIMAIAVIATLISLFAVAWPGGYPQGTPDPDSVTAKDRPLTLPDLPLIDHEGNWVRIRDQTPAVVVLVDGCDCTRVVDNLIAAVDPRINVLVVMTPDPRASASGGASAAPGYSGWPSSVPTPSRGTTPTGSLGPDFVTVPPFPTGSADPSGSPSGTPSRTPASRMGPPGARLRFLLDPAGALRSAVAGYPGTSRQGVLILVSADWAITRVTAATTPVPDLKADLERLFS
jgi:hypothetical protein